MRARDSPHIGTWGPVLVALPALASMAALGSFRGGYPLFHMMAELVSVALGFSIFLVLHHARGTVRSPALFVLGASCFFSSMLDLIHALTHEGISLIMAPPGTPEQFWTASQGVLAVGMVAASRLTGTRPGYRTVFWIFFGMASLLAASILVWGIFPACTSADSTPTPFYLASGYGFALTFAVCPFLFRANRTPFAPEVLHRLTLFLLLMASAEILYILHNGNTGPAGLISHLSKTAAYAYAYSVLAWSAFETPLASLFTALKRHEEELSGQNERLTAQGQAIARLTKDPVLTGGDLHESIPLLLETAVHVLHSDRGGIWFMNGEGTQLASFDIFLENPGLHTSGETLKSEEHSRFFAVLAEDRVLACSDGREDPVFGSFVRQIVGTGQPVAIMASGIRRRGRLVGMACQARLGAVPPWTLDQQLFLGSLADMAALALEAGERLREQREKAESEERLNALIQAIPDQVCFKDAHSRWLVANPALLDSYGLRGQDYRGRTLAELEEQAGLGNRLVFSPISQRTDETAWRDGHSSFCIVTGEPTGEVRAYEVLKKVIGPEGQPKGLMVLGRDVSSHRQALEELRHSITELDTVYNEMVDGLITIDLASRRILRANPAFRRMFGYSIRELEGLDDTQVPATGQRETVSSLLGILTSGRAASVENIRCRRKDGGTVWIDATLARFLHAGRPAVLAVVRNVTRRRLDEEALAARAAEVEALNQNLEDRVAAACEENRCKDLVLVQQSRLAVMGEMIGNIAHQWRQPLNALGLIVANLVMDVKDGSVTGEEADTYARQCRDILTSMSRTIDDFRDFFKPDKIMRHFSVKEAILEALSLVEASLAHNNVAVDLELAEDPWLWGYKGEFSQVALNLLVNARDAVTQKGRRGGRIRVSTRARDRTVEIQVADDGGGIPIETIPKVFDPYFTTKSQDKGTGLGLYLSKRIIEEHMGGSIAVVNAPEGAVFTVTLPLAETDQEEEGQAP